MAKESHSTAHDFTAAAFSACWWMDVPFVGIVGKWVTFSGDSRERGELRDKFLSGLN